MEGKPKPQQKGAIPEWKKKQLAQQQAQEDSEDKEHHSRVVIAAQEGGATATAAKKIAPLDITWYKDDMIPEDTTPIKSKTFLTLGVRNFPSKQHPHGTFLLPLCRQVKPQLFSFLVFWGGGGGFGPPGQHFRLMITKTCCSYGAGRRQNLWLSLNQLPHLTKRKVSLFTGEKPFSLVGAGLTPRAVLDGLSTPSSRSLVALLPNEMISLISRFVPPVAPVVVSAVEYRIPDMKDILNNSQLKYSDLHVTVELQMDEIEPIESVDFKFGERSSVMKFTPSGPGTLLGGYYSTEEVPRVKAVAVTPFCALSVYKFHFFRVINDCKRGQDEPSILTVTVNYGPTIKRSLTCQHRDRAYDEYINAACFTASSLIKLRCGRMVPAESLRVGSVSSTQKCVI